MRAVIIEPNKVFLQILEALFAEQDIETVQFGTGQEALGFLSTGSCDLICAALHLPDMSCIEFSREVRKIASAVLTPLVMITSEEKKEILSEGLKAGVTEVFPKSDLKLLSHYIANIAEQTLDTGESPGRILYVEDQKATASFISELLRQNGFDVLHYFKAEDALVAFENENFDLVLTDVILEGEMSGLGLVRAINTDPEKHMTPILAMSGMSDPARKVELLRAGANDYVSKPVVEGELVARVTNMVVNKRLFDKVHEQKRRMQEMAMMDQLTGLYNRHYLGETAPKYLSKACRHQYELSLMVIDLDHFKAINDTYGHMAGDTVLKEVGRVLKDFGRREDIVARFGGEEFVIMLTHCSADDAYKRAEVLRKKIEALKPAGLTVTSSIGVATLGKDIELEQCGFEQLFSAADDAVYKAKESGRNCVKVGQIAAS